MISRKLCCLTLIAFTSLAGFSMISHPFNHPNPTLKVDGSQPVPPWPGGLTADGSQPVPPWPGGLAADGGQPVPPWPGGLTA